jgi:hypothetical protein
MGIPGSGPSPVFWPTNGPPIDRSAGDVQPLQGLTSAEDVPSAFSALAGQRFSIESGHRNDALLRRVCARPELRPLLSGLSIRPVDALELPFRAVHASTIEVSSDWPNDEAVAAFHLRHALEIVLCHRLVTDRRDLASQISFAIVACHTALRYLDTMPAVERERVLDSTAPWVSKTHRGIHGHHASQHPDAAAAAVGRRWRELLPLQGLDLADTAVDDAVLAQACALASQALPMATPTEHLLTQGGDSRLAVDPHTRLNKYGCSSSPRPWAVTFSNCTASSPSDLGYEAAEESRQALLAAVVRAQRFSDGFGAEMERARDGLRSALRLESVPGAEIILAASGTDCELYALFLATAASKGNVLNVVIAPSEIGSGSLPAAHGRHFDPIVPAGHHVSAGSLVDGIPSARIHVKCVQLRSNGGQPIPQDAVDAEVASLVDAGAARGDLTLLHLLDSSKTGLRGPTVRCVRTLQERYRSGVMVVVDAAQMRTRPEAIAEFLESGWLVIASGSKFYTGSPFSGALLLPGTLAPMLDTVETLPEGFGDYLSSYEIPPRWRRLRSQLPVTANVGLLLRWLVGLWEMKAFNAVPAHEQAFFLREFARLMRHALAAHSRLTLVDSPVGDRDLSQMPTTWDAEQTIFTFVARHESGNALTYDEAWHVYNCLNMDIDRHLPESASADDRVLARKACHIGQPVQIGTSNSTTTGALRIAAGARLVSRVAFDPTLGATPAERLAAQVAAANLVLDKVDLILRHWPAFAPGS